MTKLRASLLAGLCIATTLTACAQGDTGPAVLTKDTGVVKDTADDTAVVADSTPTDTGTVDTGTDSGCAIPTGKKCGIFPQCGCAAGENCAVSSASTTGFVTKCIAVGTVGRNGKCKAHIDCALGLSCIGGLCRQFCADSTDCAGSESLCKNVTTGSPPTDVPGYMVCFTACDPMAPSKTCGTSNGCAFISDTQTTCVGAGSGTGVGGCTSDPFGCAPGFVCLTTAECRAWCRMDMSDCGGAACQALTSPPTYDGHTFGVCP